MTYVWAHRGASGYAPENTLEAFALADKMKADGIELDVHLSKDDEIIVTHDENVQRVTCGVDAMVKDLTLAELKKLDVYNGIEGYRNVRIPTLPEVLDFLKTNNLYLNIELKTGIVLYDGIEQKTIDAVRAAGNKAPLERTVAEFLFHRDRLGRAQFLRGMKEKAACVVLFCWAAALDPDAGKADIQKIRDKARGFPVLLKGHVIPEGNIESASNAVFFCGGIEFYISCFSVPNLRVDAQHGPKRRKPIRQERPKPVLLHAVGHQNCSTFIVLSLSIQCFPAAQNNAPARRQTGAQRLPQPQRSARRAGASCRTRAYLCGKYPVRLERLRLEDCQNSGQFPHKTVRCPPQRNMQAEDLQNPPPCSHKTPVALSVAVRSESSSAGILPCAVGMRIVRTRISRSGSIKRIAAPFFVRKHQLNRSW